MLPMSFQNLKFSIQNSERLEQLSDKLEELGAVSVTFEDAEDQPIFEPLPDEVIFWKNTQVSALFPSEIDLSAVIQNLRETENLQQFSQEAVMDEDWQTLWEQTWKPLCFYDRSSSQSTHKLWICPSFADTKEYAGTILRLDPGLAFGTGTHPTTALCLDWLVTYPPQDKQVIDYGCGSGILALAALKLGAKHVYAIDHDRQALQATESNARLNEIDPGCLSVLPPVILSDSEGSLRSFPRLSGDRLAKSAPQDDKRQKELHYELADLLLANILANPLIELAESFAAFLKSGGTIVLSGILSSQVVVIQDAYAPYFTKMTVIEREGWALIFGSKKHDQPT